jgi:hypothetical protein
MTTLVFVRRFLIDYARNRATRKAVNPPIARQSRRRADGRS